MKSLVTVIFLAWIVAGLVATANPSRSLDPIPPTDSVLIKNVRLISREDSLSDVIVNLLIIDKKLELVTRDEMIIGSSVVQYDGEGGFLMGSMIIGEAPNIVILDENPRTNFDIFLNTSPHIVFAMEGGTVVSK